MEEVTAWEISGQSLGQGGEERCRPEERRGSEVHDRYRYDLRWGEQCRCEGTTSGRKMRGEQCKRKVVFQDCNLLARKQMDSQNNCFTTQGRNDPNQNTAISIQNCTVSTAPDFVPVKSFFQTFLGRPWKNYSHSLYGLIYR